MRQNSSPTPPAQFFLGLGELTIRSERIGDAHLLAFGGELDLAGAHRAQAALAQVEASSAEWIVLDLRGLSFVGSAGVELLIDTARRASASPGRLSILRPDDHVLRVFVITGIDGLLPFVGVPRALAELRPLGINLGAPSGGDAVSAPADS